MRGTGLASSDGETFATAPRLNVTFSAVAIRARSTHERDQMEKASIPTCPDTSLPWSDDYDLGGWSARMFLHQLFRISTPHWKPSDTERLLSDSTPPRLRGKVGSGISLSDVLEPPDTTHSEACFRDTDMVRVLIRRALARGRSLRLLLVTERGTTPVIVTFGRKGAPCDCWSAMSEPDLPDSLKTGLLDYLQQHRPDCTETPSSPKSPNGSESGS